MNDPLLEKLYQTALSRKGGDEDSSYIAALYAEGRSKIAQKIGEEGVETALAAAVDDRDGIIKESADLLFHLSVLWADAGITPQDIAAELHRREGKSGLTEKAERDRP